MITPEAEYFHNFSRSLRSRLKGAAELAQELCAMAARPGVAAPGDILGTGRRTDVHDPSNLVVMIDSASHEVDCLMSQIEGNLMRAKLCIARQKPIEWLPIHGDDGTTAQAK